MSIAPSSAPVSPEATSSLPALPRLTREMLVLTGLLQGGLVYAFVQGWLGSEPQARAPWLSLLLAVSLFAMMSALQLRDRLWWASLAVVGAVTAGLNFSVVWFMGDRWLPRIWWPWLLAQGALLLVVLAWVQALLQHRSLRHVPYASLFTHAWNNAMVIGFVTKFVGLCWSVLGLWAGLFALLKVKLFVTTFTQPLFVCLATGGMVGVGLVLARGQPKPLRMLLQLALALCKLLLPLLSLVVVLFVLFLPFTGVQSLWETRKAAPLLMGVWLWMLLFVNAVYQDGAASEEPYPAPVRALIGAALVAMPVLAGLALWAVCLRVQQYGWTHERVWAVVMAAVLLLYAVGYAVMAVRSWQGPWLEGVQRLNPAMSWLVLALLVLLHTPLLDPYRLGAASQRERLRQSTAPVSLADLDSLRWDHGRHGLPALQSLQSEARFATGEVAQWLAQVLVATERMTRAPRPEAPPQPLAGHLELAPGHERPAQDWWAAIETPPLRDHLAHCPREDVRCLVLQLPLERQGPPLPLVCRLGGYTTSCQVFGPQAQGGWKRVGQLAWGGLSSEGRAQLAQAVQEGQLSVQTPRWNDVVVTGAQDLPAGRLRD